MSRPDDFTELEKWEKYHAAFTIIKDFLVYACEEFDVSLGKTGKDKEYGTYYRNLSSDEESQIIYKFFDIDRQKLEEERRELLNKLEANK